MTQKGTSAPPKKKTSTQKNSFRVWSDLLLPLVRLGIACAIAYGAWGVMSHWLANKPEPKKRKAPKAMLRVEAVTLKTEEYQVSLSSRGTVTPRTQTRLMPEVSGVIVEVSPSLRGGGFFKKDDVLLKIDPTNYETAVVAAQGAVAEAQVQLSEEEARAAQALENWVRLGNRREDANELVLRKPQLARVKSMIATAEAELQKAERDLERTTVRAPYDGRVLNQEVDIGQYVSPGTLLAETFATDYVEVRLPLTNNQLAFIDLPEQFAGGEISGNHDAPVTLMGKIGRTEREWRGKVVRVEGAFDDRTRELFVVAQVDDPYKKTEDDRPPMKIGMFVEAKVQGETLKNVFVLPRHAIRVDGEVVLIDKGSKIRLKKVDPIYANDEVAIVENDPENGLKAGDVLCITPIAFPAEGAPVVATVDGVQPKKKRRGPES